MSLGGRIFAAMYDPMMGRGEKAGLAERRAALLAQASGRVLEVGAGTGLNLRHYGEQVESLTVTEPEEPMAKRLRRRVGEQPRRVELVVASAEALPFPDAEFDTVVSTLVLCTVRDQPRALSELRRVLKPGGKLLFLEHLRSDDPKVARRQDRMNGFNQVVAHGCNCNRKTLDAIGEAGFTITAVEHGELPKTPSFIAPMAFGTATA
jgi:ubiquinone/menaquinone biosynthesis C-methylase UbiE